ncbi:MAG: hypothetical protein LUE31_01970, partial [Lachnospiraceae bacterium]|nr:hypothetical protein [Lachnospiraceae bacterium]
MSNVINLENVNSEALNRAGKIGRVGITERAHHLKREAIWKTPNGDEFPEGVKACMERARFYTQAYQASEGEPDQIRRAKAFANALDNMTIFIKDKELIVGYCTSKPEYLPLWPELSNNCNREALKEPYLTDEEKEEYRKYVEYWMPRTLQSRTERLLTDEEKDVVSTGVILGNGTYQSGYTSPSPGMANVLDNGLEKIIADVKAKLDAAEERIHGSVAFGPEEVELVKKTEEWKAMLIADEAVIRWTARYSKLATVMAEHEADPVRKAELEEIARIALKVPAKPAEHFQEAVQCIWFLTICYHQVERLSSGCPYR